MVLQLLIKQADISHGCKPVRGAALLFLSCQVPAFKIFVSVATILSSSQTELHVKWSERIQEEFFVQGDDEKDLGIEIGMVNGPWRRALQWCSFHKMRLVIV